MNQSLSLQWTGVSIVISIVLLLATGFVCWLSWHRRGYSMGHGVLEAIRFMLVAMVVATLNQPELLTQFQPDEEPTVAVLWDQSASMETRDVIDEDQPAAPPRSRQEWVEPFLNNEAIWKPISNRFNVVFEPFSSTSGNPEDGTDIYKALLGSMDKHKNLRGVVLFSDGDWNQGEAPIRAASKLRMHQNRVFAVGVGSETKLPDVQIASLDAPTFGVVGKPLRIPFAIRSSLPLDYKASVTLSTSSGEEITKEITIPAMGSADDALVWTPKTIGDYDLSLKIPVHEDEFVKSNNVRTEPIAIRKESLNVLLVESFPRWEYRYLRNALERDPGVDVSCLLFHPGLSKVGGGRGYLEKFPDSLETLSKFDVVFLGDVGVQPGQLTAEHCRLLKGLVQSQASGLVFLPGRRGNQMTIVASELKDLYPVTLDPAQPQGWGSRIPYQFELTEAGRRSLLTKLADSQDENAQVWESLPGFQWYAPIVKSKPGTEVLAVHKSESNRFGRIPLLATKTFGTGKILFLGTDGAWRWREGVEDRYHYRMWGQVARWMAYQRNMARGDSMRLFYAPDRPQRDNRVTLNANVMSSAGEPLQSGRVNVQLISPAGKPENVKLNSIEQEWGLFSGSFIPEENGEYKVIMTCRENGATLETSISVHGADRELKGEPARYDVLEEIATVTQGEMVTPDKVQNLLDKIAALPMAAPETRRLRIWCHPVWAGFIVGLLGLFWTGRKIVGAI